MLDEEKGSKIRRESPNKTLLKYTFDGDNLSSGFAVFNCHICQKKLTRVRNLFVGYLSQSSFLVTLIIINDLSCEDEEVQ